VHQTPNALVFGLGDYLDWMRTTHRLAIKSLWNEDDSALQQYDTMVLNQLIRPYAFTIRTYCPSYREKFVGFVEGNHHGHMMSSRFANGQTTTEVLCEELGIPYLGLSAWVRLTAYRSRSKTKFGAAHNLNVVLNHSTSSSGKLANSLASAQRKLEGWRGVDIFLSGNDHQLGHVLRQEIGCTDRGAPRMVQYQQIIGKVGSFQKSYLPGAKSDAYEEKKFLSPAQLGWLEFDAWVHTTEAEQGAGVTHTPETWRYGNFNV